MLWQGRRQSSNVDDRRGISGGQVAVGGGILGVIALVLNFLLGGGDVSQLPQQLPNQGTQMSAEEEAADNQRAEFVKVVLADTEDIWNQLFAKMITLNRRWSCSGVVFSRPVVVPVRPRVLSTALAIINCTSTFPFTRIYRTAFVHRVISPWLTLWHTRLVTISRQYWEFQIRWRG